MGVLLEFDRRRAVIRRVVDKNIKTKIVKTKIQTSSLVAFWRLVQLKNHLF